MSKYAQQLEFLVLVNGVKIKVIIDSRVHSDFVSENYIWKNGLGITDKEEPYRVRAYDGIVSKDNHVKLET